MSCMTRLRPLSCSAHVFFFFLAASWLISCLYSCEKNPVRYECLWKGRVALQLKAPETTSSRSPPPPPPPDCTLPPLPQMCPLEVSLSRKPSRLQGCCSAADPLPWPLQGEQTGWKKKNRGYEFPQTSDALMCILNLTQVWYYPAFIGWVSLHICKSQIGTLSFTDWNVVSKERQLHSITLFV